MDKNIIHRINDSRYETGVLLYRIDEESSVGCVDIEAISEYCRVVDGDFSVVGSVTEIFRPEGR